MVVLQHSDSLVTIMVGNYAASEHNPVSDYTVCIKNDKRPLSGNQPDE